MFCNKCGTQVEDGAQFCPNCGERVGSVAPQSVYTGGVNSYAPVANSTPVLVMGILAIAFACSFFTSFLGIIFGAIGRKKANNYLLESGSLTGKAKVGSILSKIGLIVGIIGTIGFVIYIIAMIALGASLSYYY